VSSRVVIVGKRHEDEINELDSESVTEAIKTG
jgi:hypothetical protein